MEVDNRYYPPQYTTSWPHKKGLQSKFESDGSRFSDVDFLCHIRHTLLSNSTRLSKDKSNSRTKQQPRFSWRNKVSNICNDCMMRREDVLGHTECKSSHHRFFHEGSATRAAISGFEIRMHKVPLKFSLVLKLSFLTHAYSRWIFINRRFSLLCVSVTEPSMSWSCSNSIGS